MRPASGHELGILARILTEAFERDEQIVVSIDSAYDRAAFHPGDHDGLVDYVDDLLARERPGREHVYAVVVRFFEAGSGPARPKTVGGFRIVDGIRETVSAEEMTEASGTHSVTGAVLPPDPAVTFVDGAAILARLQGEAPRSATVIRFPRRTDA